QFDRAPGFLLSNFDGGTVSLTDSVGKIRVVNSWATWCPFCVEELADFVRLQEEFSDRVVVVTINRSESLSKARSFADELGITDGMTMLLDPKDSFYKSIGGFSMPETLFIDGDGNIRVHKRGPMRFEEMKEKVESIINSS
ncbi:TlpA family protein disulfide reductase, partial [Candidatus Kaiserbacteria bacterium]|nr:TlpA family protein disulfide reductase [Candidatus Kaiserbacteria bacterium]